MAACTGVIVGKFNDSIAVFISACKGTFSSLHARRGFILCSVVIGVEIKCFYCLQPHMSNLNITSTCTWDIGAT